MEVLTTHLLDLLAVIGSHCSDVEVRKSLCLVVTSLASALNQKDLGLLRVIADRHPYVMSDSQFSDFKHGTRLNGCGYIIHHFHRIRHLIMEVELMKASSDNRSRMKQPCTFNSLERRYIELQSESIKLKQELFEKVWSMNFKSHWHCCIPTEAMLPWNVVTSTVLTEILNNEEIAGEYSHDYFEKRLRLRRSASLNWNMFGVALFIFYYWLLDQEDGTRTGTGTDRPSSFESHCKDSSYNFWCIDIMLPVTFSLLEHDVVKNYEGLHCVSLLSSLPSHLSLLTNQPPVKFDCLMPHSFCNHVSSILCFDWKYDIVATYKSITCRNSVEDYASLRLLHRVKGAISICLQNTFMLCQLIVNALLQSSDRLILRKGQLALRWAIYNLHSPHLHIQFPVPTATHTEATSLLILRRLVDMCPFPQAKGLLTDITKDFLQHTCPFTLMSTRGSDASEHLELRPPPILSPSHVTQHFANGTDGMASIADIKSREWNEEIRSLTYSDELDSYMIEVTTGMSRKCELEVVRPDNWQGFPLRVLLELFVLPALVAMNAVRSSHFIDKCSCSDGSELTEILDKIDWFSSAVSLLRLIRLKIHHKLGNNLINESALSSCLVVSSVFPSIPDMMNSCYRILKDNVDLLQSYSDSLSNCHDSSRSEKGRSYQQARLQLEVVLMNMSVDDE